MDSRAGALYARAMVSARFRNGNRNRLLIALAVLALAVRLLIPAGFMPSHDARGPAIVFCSGEGPMMAMPMAGSAMKGMKAAGKMPMAGHPCGFDDLGMAAIGGADPALLLATIAFVMARGLGPSRPLSPRLPDRLRPPLRAPPRPLSA